MSASKDPGQAPDASGQHPGQHPERSAAGSAAAPESVPGYLNLVRIGQGGFSVVYRAIQEDFDRKVALKILTAAPDEDARRRFQRELRLTGRLSGHPHVVTVLDAGETALGRLYLAMHLYEAGSLKDRLAADGPLTPEQVASVGAKIGDALAAAHGLGVVHRDVKPSNILVSRFGEPALADFGVSCLLDAGSSVSVLDAFSPQHAAPELISRGAPSEASDIYALGSTLYQLLTGHPAFGRDGEDVLAVMWQVVNKPLPRPDCELPGLADAIIKAMAKDPADRFPDAASFARTLRGLVPEVAPLNVPDAVPPGAAAKAAVPPAPPLSAAVLPEPVQADATGSSPTDDGRTELRPDRAAPKSVVAGAKPGRRRPALLIGGVVLAACVLAGGLAFAARSSPKDAASKAQDSAQSTTRTVSSRAGRTASSAKRGHTVAASSPGGQDGNRGTGPGGSSGPGRTTSPGGSKPKPSASPSPTRTLGPVDSDYLSGTQVVSDGCEAWLDYEYGGKYGDGGYVKPRAESTGVDCTQNFIRGYWPDPSATGSGANLNILNDVNSGDNFDFTGVWRFDGYGYYASVCIWNNSDPGGEVCSPSFYLDDHKVVLYQS
jgi:serine/threonine protein kinase